MYIKTLKPTICKIKASVITLALLILITGCGQGNRCGCDARGFDIYSFNFFHHVQGSGNVVRETRLIEDVSTVVLSEEGDLYIDMGDKEKLIIEAEDNLQEYLIAEVEYSVLDIKKLPDNIILEATKPIQYYLTLTELKSLTVKNSGDVDITGVVTDLFRVYVTGSGSVRIGSLNLRQLDVELSSSGNLTIGRGVAEVQNITLSSSGEYDGSNVESLQVDVGLSSSGNARINVLDKLEVNLSSSGNVYYLGDPGIITNESSSTGRLIKMQ
jgi:hypothetical protein